MMKNYFVTPSRNMAFIIYTLVNNPAGHRFTCLKSIILIAVSGRLEVVTADSDIRWDITPLYKIIPPVSCCRLFGMKFHAVSES